MSTDTVGARFARLDWLDWRDIARDVAGAGNGFFSERARRFFSSRVARGGWRVRAENGWDHVDVIVTSEPDFYGNDRRYSVRVFRYSDYMRHVTRIDDVGGFRAYATSGQAQRVAERVARQILAGAGDPVG